MRKYTVKKLVLTPEDKLIKLINEAIDSLDLSCTSVSGDRLGVWITKPDEFLDENYTKCVEDETDPSIFYVTISGGMNGNGKWSNYLTILHDLFIKLESVFEDAWVIEVWNDCLDDVFYVRVGIRAYFSHDSKPYTHITQQEAEKLTLYEYDLSDRIFHSASIKAK